MLKKFAYSRFVTSHLSTDVNAKAGRRIPSLNTSWTLNFVLVYLAAIGHVKKDPLVFVLGWSKAFAKPKPTIKPFANLFTTTRRKKIINHIFLKTEFIKSILPYINPFDMHIFHPNKMQTG